MDNQRSDAHIADAQSLGISADLLNILVCPVDHSALEVVDNGLRCTGCQRTYPVRDGIPSMVGDSVTP